MVSDPTPKAVPGTEMAVAVMIPRRDLHPVAWWRAVAADCLNDAIHRAGRLRSGAVRFTIQYGAPATVTAWADTRPDRR